MHIGKATRAILPAPSMQALKHLAYVLPLAETVGTLLRVKMASEEMASDLDVWEAMKDADERGKPLEIADNIGKLRFMWSENSIME